MTIGELIDKIQNIERLETEYEMLVQHEELTGITSRRIELETLIGIYRAESIEGNNEE